MPRSQQQFNSSLSRTSAIAHIAERTHGNIGGIFNNGHRADVFHNDTHAGQPASAIWNDDPQPDEAATLRSQ
eukprot:5040752-Pyramimonas_sp.AAC.1